MLVKAPDTALLPVSGVPMRLLIGVADRRRTDLARGGEIRHGDGSRQGHKGRTPRTKANSAREYPSNSSAAEGRMVQGKRSAATRISVITLPSWTKGTPK